MTDKPNFVLIPDEAPSGTPPARAQTGGILARLRTMATTAVTAPAALLSALGHAGPPAETGTPTRPRLIFAVGATASREPSVAASRPGLSGNTLPK